MPGRRCVRQGSRKRLQQLRVVRWDLMQRMAFRFVLVLSVEASKVPTVSEVSCSGQEGSILQSPHGEGDDVFCATEECVVVRCLGSGDAVGQAA